MKMYEAEYKGKPVAVTIPDSETLLIDALQQSLSPVGIVGIASALITFRSTDGEANTQVKWFRQMLIEMVGIQEFHRIAEEIGC